MSLFNKERFPEGAVTATDVAYYRACPRCYGIIDQTEMSAPPWCFDQKRRISLRHSYFLDVYAGILKRIIDRGGIVPEDKIDRLVEEAYHDARKSVRHRMPALLDEHLKGAARKNAQYTLEKFNIAIWQDLDQIDEWGRERLQNELKAWARNNYGKDSPKFLVKAVSVGHLFEHSSETLAGRPNLVVVYNNPNDIKLFKIKGGAVTEEYRGGPFLEIDKAKMATDYIVARNDSETLKTERDLNVRLSPALIIKGSNMDKLVFEATELEGEIWQAYRSIQNYRKTKKEKERRGEHLWWKDLPVKDKTCLGLHQKEEIEVEAAGSVSS